MAMYVYIRTSRHQEPDRPLIDHTSGELSNV